MQLLALPHPFTKFHKREAEFVSWLDALPYPFTWFDLHIYAHFLLPQESQVSTTLAFSSITHLSLYTASSSWTLKPAFFSHPSSQFSSLISPSQTSVKDHLHMFSPFLHSHSSATCSLMVICTPSWKPLDQKSNFHCSFSDFSFYWPLLSSAPVGHCL